MLITSGYGPQDLINMRKRYYTLVDETDSDYE